MAKNASSRKRVHRFGLRERLGAIFVSLVLLTGLTIALLGYRMVNTVEVSLTRQLAHNISRTVMHEIEHSLYDPVQPFVQGLAHGMLPRARTERERLQLLPLLRTFMKSYPVVESIHAGYRDGDYLLFQRMRREKGREDLKAPPKSAFMLAYIERGEGGVGYNRVTFYDEDLTVLRHLQGEAGIDDDPRTRPWYRKAQETVERTETGPFIIASSTLPAVTFSKRSPDGDAVVAIDILVNQLSDFLLAIRPTPGSRILLLREDGALLASTTGMTTGGSSDVRMRTREDFRQASVLALQQYERGYRGLDIDFEAEGRKWVVFMEELALAAGAKNPVILLVPRSEMLDESDFFRLYVPFAAAVILVITALAVWLAARLIFNPLRELATRARDIQDLRLDEEERIVSGVTEIDDLAEGMHRMQANAQKLLSLAYTINGEKDATKLLKQVLREIMSVSDSDGSIISLLDEDGNKLDDGVVCWLGGDGEFQFQPLRRTQIGDESLIASIFESELVHELLARSDPRSGAYPFAAGFEEPGVSALDLLGMPLRGRMGEKLGVFGLIRRIRSGEEQFRPPQLALVEGLAKIVAIAIDNRQLFEKQRALLDAVIQIAAGAIDAKSPYTGGHCARVPILFQMLLQAACDEKEGTFKDFCLDDDGWEEARLAAWLHDWGKVTTPEFVMDKATKLETMYDRIHEIRTRFEVLRRDAEIESLRALLAGGDPEEEGRKLAATFRALDEDFAFVASCNDGSRPLGDADLERLRAIGSRTWLRNFDKTLGVSRDERSRMERVDGLGLPAIERLLADKSEHIIERNGADVIAPDNPWGFRIETPQYLYNRGELYNLSVRTGTLTEEERYKINDHITQTIVMLDKVPLPKHLRNVPEIAGAHHETMDGRGYPRRLTRDQMSWPARMMAVADIFEALTASDRPYKSSKTLSEALEIMADFKRKNHIDPDVYELFLRADIPRRYAGQCLKPEQDDMPG